MAMKSGDDQFSDEEAARRRDALARHMLKTPPKPQSEMKLGKAKKKPGARRKRNQAD
jgi:hypothetical protein